MCVLFESMCVCACSDAENAVELRSVSYMEDILQIDNNEHMQLNKPNYWDTMEITLCL